MSINLKNELSLINKKMDALQEEYRIKIKAFASDSNTSSADLEGLYINNLTSYIGKNEYGTLTDIWHLKYNLGEELSKNINTPKNFLLEIASCIAYPPTIQETAINTFTKQVLLTIKNKKSTKEELNEIYSLIRDYEKLNIDKLSIYEIYIDLVKHPNVNYQLLDKMSCIYDEVDELILKHPQVYVKTKKKINRKR